MIRFDSYDKKILFELDVNSRQSFNEIGRAVRLSKDAVIYRINKLKADGIIKSFHTIIDVSKLGYISFRLYIKFQNTDPKKEKEIIEYLKKQNNITWLSSCESEFDIALWVLAKDMAEMNKLWTEIHSKFRDYFARKKLAIFTKVAYYPRGYLIGEKSNDEEFRFITESKKEEIEELDMNILKKISVDARKPIYEIANELSVTPKTIISHIKSLEDRKIIIGYRTMFDIGKLEHEYYKLHFNLHNVNSLENHPIKHYIKNHPNIIYDNEVLGGDDIEIDVQVKNLLELRELIDEFKKKYSNIIRDYSLIAFKEEHKYLFLPAI